MRKALGGAVAAVAAGTLLSVVTGGAPGWPRPWLVAMHVLGVVLFLGNALTGAAWFGLAEAAGSTRVVAFAARTLCVLDLAFTAPGALLLAFSGASLSAAWGGVWGPGWLTWALGCFALAGALWGTLLAPLQLRLHALASAAPEGPLPAALSVLLHRYYAAGGVTGALMLLAFTLMLLKP